MNLIPSSAATIYSSAIDNIHDSFSQIIQVVKSIKKPNNVPISDNDDNYDLNFDRSIGIPDEFEYDIITTNISARVKYLDKQEKEFEFAITRSEGINLTQEFGIIRIKVHIKDVPIVDDATRIIVDGNNCQILFRNQDHGLLAFQYSTYYLQRTP